jgi:hypothetical protein
MLSGKIGIKDDYEVFQNDQIESYRLRAREHFQQSNQIFPLNDVISTFKDLKKKKSAVATVGDGRNGDDSDGGVPVVH